MHSLLLQFENGEELDVRSFRVSETISRPFRIDVVARSTNHDVSFETMIGRPAIFRLTNGAVFATVPVRTWVGVCTKCEQTRVEHGGLSTYEVTIEPQLWLLSQRRNHRIFQHQSIPQIVGALLSEWGVPHETKLGEDAYPALEIRVQYGETDLDFVSRLLEEAGISFTFGEREGATIVQLADRPHGHDPRPGAALSFVDAPEEAQAAQVEYLTMLRVRREARPAKVVLRDFDFRNPRFELEASAGVPAGIEEKLEQYHYAPGRFVTEGHAGGDTPVADDRGVARFHQPAGAALAARLLEAQRANRRGITFRTNAFDLAPGRVFSVADHPRAELASKERLLATEMVIEGEVAQEWIASGKAVFADAPYRPSEVTRKPSIDGVQSAIVVGPKGDAVHTDEFGRVRVQFHWDRSMRYDEESSCWVRVSQAWAGTGYGLINLPRVGHEVLISFLEGNPDHPIVVGRVFNGAQQVPYMLPGSKLISAWKSDSNSNIILFDDTPGEEGFYEQAEKDRVGIVKHDETYMTGGDRVVAVAKNEETLVGVSSERFAFKEHSILAGKAVDSTAAVEWSATGGLTAEITAGKEVELGVQPVVPFIMAIIDVLQAKAALDEALPGGHPPDLAAVLPDFTKGSLVLKSPEAASPVMFEKEQVQQAVKDVIDLFGSALKETTPKQFSKLVGAHGLEAGIAVLLDNVKKKGGPAQLVALADMGHLLEHLKGILAALMAQQQEEGGATHSEASEKEEGESSAIDTLQAIASAILAKLVPSTTITIEDQKITIETEKASIEIDDDSITLEAEGDIEIKAGGKVKIEGECVEITPSPCKCGA